MTRVLMTADAVGGVWTYALDLCRALAAHDVEVILATMGPAPSGAQQRDVAALPRVTLRVSTFALEWMPHPWRDIGRAGDWLLKIEQEENPDVIHLNGYAHGALPWRAPVLVAGHSCVLSWWQAVKGVDAPAEWSPYHRAVAQGLHGADRVVAPTRTMLDALHRHYGHLPRAQVIHNGRSASLYRSGTKEPFVLSAGRLWDEAKNIASLGRIAGRLPWPVRIAGQVAAERHAGDIAGNAEFLGRLDPPALAEQMSRAAIYALPARYEPFGLSVLEAALSGCALVLGDIPSLREVWGDAALFIPPEDDAALTSAIARLIADVDLRRQMALRAAMQARRYTPARMAGAYFNTYRDMERARADISASAIGITRE